MNVRIPAAFLATLSAFSAALAQPVSNREAPQLLSAEGFSSTPMVFVPILPCRLADTRAAYGFTGAYGPPALVGASARTFNIPGGPCPGIPADAGAFSINIGVLGALDGIDPGYLTVFPTGTPFPPTSDINFLGQTIQNALVARCWRRWVHRHLRECLNEHLYRHQRLLPAAGDRARNRRQPRDFKGSRRTRGPRGGISREGREALFASGDAHVASGRQNGSVGNPSKSHDQAVIGVYSARHSDAARSDERAIGLHRYSECYARFRSQSPVKFKAVASAWWVLLCSASSLVAATHTWTGAVSSLWSNNANWTGGTPAGDPTPTSSSRPTSAQDQHERHSPG